MRAWIQRLLGRGELALVELRLAGHAAGNTPLRRRGGWVARQQQPRHFEGARQVVRLVQIFGGARQHAGAIRMVGNTCANLTPDSMPRVCQALRSPAGSSASCFW